MEQLFHLIQRIVKEIVFDTQEENKKNTSSVQIYWEQLQLLYLQFPVLRRTTIDYLINFQEYLNSISDPKSFEKLLNLVLIYFCDFPRDEIWRKIVIFLIPQNSIIPPFIEVLNSEKIEFEIKLNLIHSFFFCDFPSDFWDQLPSFDFGPSLVLLEREITTSPKISKTVFKFPAFKLLYSHLQNSSHQVTHKFSRSLRIFFSVISQIQFLDPNLYIHSSEPFDWKKYFNLSSSCNYIFSSQSAQTLHSFISQILLQFPISESIKFLFYLIQNNVLSFQFILNELKILWEVSIEFKKNIYATLLDSTVVNHLIGEFLASIWISEIGNEASQQFLILENLLLLLNYERDIDCYEEWSFDTSQKLPLLNFFLVTLFSSLYQEKKFIGMITILNQLYETSSTIFPQSIQKFKMKLLYFFINCENDFSFQDANLTCLYLSPNQVIFVLQKSIPFFLSKWKNFHRGTMRHKSPKLQFLFNLFKSFYSQQSSSSNAKSIFEFSIVESFLDSLLIYQMYLNYSLALSQVALDISFWLFELAKFPFQKWLARNFVTYFDLLLPCLETRIQYESENIIKALIIFLYSLDSKDLINTQKEKIESLINKIKKLENDFQEEKQDFLLKQKLLSYLDSDSKDFIKTIFSQFYTFSPHNRYHFTIFCNQLVFSKYKGYELIQEFISPLSKELQSCISTFFLETEKHSSLGKNLSFSPLRFGILLQQYVGASQIPNLIHLTQNVFQMISHCENQETLQSIVNIVRDYDKWILIEVLEFECSKMLTLISQTSLTKIYSTLCFLSSFSSFNWNRVFDVKFCNALWISETFHLLLDVIEFLMKSSVTFLSTIFLFQRLVWILPKLLKISTLPLFDRIKSLLQSIFHFSIPLPSINEKDFFFSKIQLNENDKINYFLTSQSIPLSSISDFDKIQRQNMNLVDIISITQLLYTCKSISFIHNEKTFYMLLCPPFHRWLNWEISSQIPSNSLYYLQIIAKIFLPLEFEGRLDYLLKNYLICILESGGIPNIAFSILQVFQQFSKISAQNPQLSAWFLEIFSELINVELYLQDPIFFQILEFIPEELLIPFQLKKMSNFFELLLSIFQHTIFQKWNEMLLPFLKAFILNFSKIEGSIEKENTWLEFFRKCFSENPPLRDSFSKCYTYLGLNSFISSVNSSLLEKLINQKEMKWIEILKCSENVPYIFSNNLDSSFSMSSDSTLEKKLKTDYPSFFQKPSKLEISSIDESSTIEFPINLELNLTPTQEEEKNMVIELDNGTTQEGSENNSTFSKEDLMHGVNFITESTEYKDESSTSFETSDWNQIKKSENLQGIISKFSLKQKMKQKNSTKRITQRFNIIPKASIQNPNNSLSNTSSQEHNNLDNLSNQNLNNSNSSNQEHNNLDNLSNQNINNLSTKSSISNTVEQRLKAQVSLKEEKEQQSKQVQEEEEEQQEIFFI